MPVWTILSTVSAVANFDPLTKTVAVPKGAAVHNVLLVVFGPQNLYRSHFDKYSMKF
jgi:hypothetical protein